ncbi:DUF7768 domain-containing protein [Pygmaiobacter massiliensis]|uniref:DUF7768 domain-containing protein n=1 Tax=Pygmaiobacter massiliensis TaxID=1917873 RepID=UPI00289A5966|nr:DUF4406 domain-containing protein [Pygmaiobacter massiliensis]
MKVICVASPYAGDIQKNTEFAKRACRHVMNEGYAFFAPHLLYPNLLDDSLPQERQLGIDMGLAMLEHCDELWCYGDRISRGMMQEIAEADSLGIPVRRVMEQENGFVIGKSRTVKMAEAPQQAMAVGMV